MQKNLSPKYIPGPAQPRPCFKSHSQIHSQAGKGFPKESQFSFCLSKCVREGPTHNPHYSSQKHRSHSLVPVLLRSLIMDNPRKLISLPSCPLSQPFVRQLDLVPPGERPPTFFWLLSAFLPPTSWPLGWKKNCSSEGRGCGWHGREDGEPVQVYESPPCHTRIHICLLCAPLLPLRSRGWALIHFSCVFRYPIHLSPCRVYPLCADKNNRISKAKEEGHIIGLVCCGW